MNITKKLVVIVNIFFSVSYFFGQDIQLIDNIPIFQEECIIEGEDGIAVLSDGSIIVCDSRAGNFKIFDKNGRFLKIFGKRGDGPDEFSTPKLYDYSDSILLINDLIKNRIIIYQINDALEWKKKDVFLATCVDAKIHSDGYLLSNPKTDKKGNWHYLYAVNPERTEYTYLLTMEDILNLPHDDSLFSNQNKLKELMNIGARVYCDYFGDSIFAVWEGQLSIIQVDMKTLKKTRYGQITPTYKIPVATQEIIRAKKDRNLKEYYNELNKYSMIRKIFVSDKYIGIVYMNYNREIDMLNPVVQLYSLNGKYLIEKKLEEVTYPHRLMSLYFDKNANNLYALSMKIDDQSESHYTLLKYEIR